MRVVTPPEPKGSIFTVDEIPQPCQRPPRLAQPQTQVRATITKDRQLRTKHAQQRRRASFYGVAVR